MAELAANGAQTYLAAAITSATQTDVSVNSASAFPSSGDFAILVTDGTNYELMEVTGVSGTTFTVTRKSEKWNGSQTAYTFASGTGTTVTQVITEGTIAGVVGAAPLASPAFTGTPTAPTASALTDSTQLATTAYADSAVGVEKTRAETAEAELVPLSTVTEAGDLIVGTGSGAVERLAAGSDGDVLTSNGSGEVPSWQAASGGSFPLSTPLSGNIPANVTLPASIVTTVFTTGTLAVGTWLVTFGLTWSPTSVVAALCSLEAVVASGTATLSGQYATQSSYHYTAAELCQAAALTFLVVVTEAATVSLEADANNASTAVYAYPYAGSTGWTATRVA